MITRRRNGPSSSHPSTLELTPTEREVWALVEQGKSAKQIAAALGRGVKGIQSRIVVARDKVRTAKAVEAAEGRS